MNYDDFVSLVREVISESKRTQDRRLRAFTNDITRSIMSIYSGRNPSLNTLKISVDDLGVDPSTGGDEFYEIEAGAFPLALDPESIDTEIFYDGVDPFISVVLEIDKNSDRFNVSATDKNIVGGDLGIHIAIETPPGFDKSKMGILRDEVANSVRHELEHVTQGEVSDQPGRAFARGKKYYSFIHGPESVSSSHAKYLLKPAEIPAHIRGYAQNAKSLNSLKNSFEDLLSNYVDKGLISEKEKQVVLDTWLDWSKNNINRKNF